MAEDSTRDHDDSHRTRAKDAGSPQTTSDFDHANAPPGGPAYSASLLGDPRLNGRGNGPVKASVMRQAQQTYGNRAVQRVIQRCASCDEPPVQRQTPNENQSPEQGAPTGAGAGGPASLSGATVDITGGVVNINAPMTRASGVLQVDTLIANTVIGTSYTPGAGNLQ